MDLEIYGIKNPFLMKIIFRACAHILHGCGLFLPAKNKDCYDVLRIIALAEF